jgi:hypothetical protein
MANIVGDIAIKVGADISPLVRDMGRANAEVAGLGGKLGGLSKGLGTATLAGGALAGAVLAAGTALAALTRASMENIDGLSKQARAVGISVASFQAMALVAEEAGVESEKFGKLLIKMQDNIASLNSGTAAQVQQFQALGLSMSSLAGLGADEQFRLIAERISAITEPSERTAAALNIFGKAGADAITMLDGYGAAVDNAAAFQRQFGIAVSDTDAQNIEAANDAMGRLGIAVTGVGNVLAAEFAPAMTAAAEGLLAFIENTFSAEAAMESLVGSLDEAKALLGEDVYEALITSAGAVNENAGAVRDLAYEYDALEVQIEATARAVDGTIYDLGDSPIAQQLADILSLMESLQIEAVQGTKSYEEMTAQINAGAAEAVRLLEEAAKINGLDVSFAVQAFNTLTRAIGVTVAAADDLRAAMPGGTPAPGPTTDDRGLAIADSRAGMVGDFAPETSPRAERPPFELGVPDIETGGGGGGGGGSNSLEERLQRMRDEFQSESELLQSQFDERLAKLAEFRDAKLLGEEEYNALERQVKADHEKSLADLEQRSRAERLAGVADAFGQFASLMTSGSQKLFKIGQAAAIAEAVVNGYSAAVAAWDKGMKIGGPVVAGAFAAGSLVKTGALISSIKSQSSGSVGATNSASGGFGGATSAALSQRAAAPAAAAAAPDQSQIVNISLTGDSIGRDGMSSLFDQINKGLAKGYRIERVNFT